MVNYITCMSKRFAIDHVREVRYFTQAQCKDANLNQFPYKTFKLDEDKDKVLAKYCNEAELISLTKQASRIMKTIYKTLKVTLLAVLALFITTTCSYRY